MYVALKAWSELPDGQMAGTSDAFQTPGVCIFPFQFTDFVKHCITNLLSSCNSLVSCLLQVDELLLECVFVLQYHLLCLHIMLQQAVSNRLSFGMTPKTVRLPKNGEMLLSVHGSPLGVYKEENLAAIQGIHLVPSLVFLCQKPHLVFSSKVTIFLLPESGNGNEDAPC